MNKTLSSTNKELLQVAKTIAFDVPTLKDLTSEQLKKVAELVIMERYKNELNKEVELSKFDFCEMKDLFISTFGSENTKAAYKVALSQFETFCNGCGVSNLLAVSAAVIDDFIYSQVKENKSNSTVRRNVRALSSFFTFCERRSNGIIKNVVKGTKATPKEKTTNKNKFYSYGVDLNGLNRVKSDFDKIINNIENKELKAIIYISIKSGLRVGAFAGLSIHGNKYKTFSKGKEITGLFDDQTISYIDGLGIKHNKPFERYTDTRLKNLFKYHTNKLFKQGVISANYSFHDMRHYFSLNNYLTHKDIYRLSKELNHSSIAITEKYLKGLKVAA
jgi:site-specific recombinase XerD